MVLDFPHPNTVKELQGFLGLLNFYRRFLLAVAHTLQPLTDALRGDRKRVDPVEQSADMEAAFTASKKALASATYLAHPLPGAVLSLSVDASVTHIGAGLHQHRPCSVIWELLGFFSQKLEPAQTRYSAFDRELLACSFGICHFRHMLEGQQFTIFTDHKPLTYALSRLSDPWTARQARQLLYVAEYTSEICHMAGVNNDVADTFSSATRGVSVPASVATAVKAPPGSAVAALNTGESSSTTSSSSLPALVAAAGSAAAVTSAGGISSPSSPSPASAAAAWSAAAALSVLCLIRSCCYSGVDHSSYRQCG